MSSPNPHSTLRNQQSAAPHSAVRHPQWLWSVAASAAGACSALAGLAVLAGWWFQVPLLKSILPGVVSMKPNTALAFVLAGAALALLAGPPVSPRRARAGQLLALLVVLIGGLTLGEFVFGWRLGIDELLFKDEPSAVATLIPGRMAPSTAGCFVLLGLALTGIGWEPRRGFRPAEWLALVVVAVGLVSLVEYAIGQPILYSFSQYTRMAVHTAGAFLALSAGVMLARPAQGLVGALRSGRIGRWEQGVYAAVGLALLGVLAGGAWFYHAQEQHVRRDVEANLEAIAQLKVNQIVQWRAERLGDGAILTSSRLFSEAVARWLIEPQPRDGEQILAQLRAVQNNHQYQDVLLVDARGQVQLSISGRPAALPEETIQALATAFQTRRPLLTDLHVPPGDPSPHFEVIAPLFAGNGTPSEPIGAVILQTQARQFLYPLIQSWPTASASAETLLVRREGDSVLFLNELRHRRDPALTLRIPLTRQDLPAAAAVLGREGVFAGKDYRGVDVLTVLKHIPDSAWFMVTKVDQSEALEVWSLQAGLIVAVLVLLVLVLAAATRMIGLQRDKYRELAQATAALRESEVRFQLMAENVKDYAVIMLDVGGHVVNWNAGAEHIKGWRADEIVGQHFSRFYPPEDVASDKPERELAVATAAGRFEAEDWRVRKDGSRFMANVVITALRDDAGQLRGFAKITRDITARKRTEEEVRASEVRYRRLFETAKDGILILDAQTGMIVDVNPFLIELLDFPRESFLGKKVWELGFFKDIVANEANFAELQQKEYVRYEDMPLETSDGRQIEAEFVSNVYLVNQQKVIQCNIRNVTDRVQAEAETHKLVAIVEHSSEFISLAALDGRLIFLNEAGGRMVGVAPEDVARTHLLQVVPDALKTKVQTELLPLLLAGGIWEGELQYQNLQTGRLIDVHASTFGITDPATGKLKFLANVTHDITGRKRAEELLREREQRLASIYDAVGDAIFLLAVEAEGRYRFVSVNRAFLATTGLTSGQVVGKRVDEIIPEPSLGMVLEKYAAAVREKRTVRWEETSAYPTGRLTGEVSIAPLMDAAGRCIQLVGAVHDITDRKRMDEALVAHREHLEQAVAERTKDLEGARTAALSLMQDADEQRQRMEQTVAQLAASEKAVREAHDELRRANAGLAQASRFKDEFLANMSHELRTPLNAILGLSEALLEQTSGTLTPRQIKSITTISTSGTHLLALINDILDLSKIEAGRLELNLDTVNVPEFCESCLVFVRTQAMKKYIGIAFEHDACVAKLTADPKRLKQILVNLLTNAVKFTPEGGRIGLTVTASEGEDAVRFAVWDTGIGITPPDQQKLFQAFTQIDSGLSRSQEGTGLGLALVAKLVELHGGSVALESEPGKGSRFIVTLPRAAAPARAAPPTDATDRRSCRRALVIEDDPTSGALLVNYLTELGLESVLHLRGEKSVEAVLRERPDVILLDILMPDESGWVVLTRLKEHPQTRDIPVVVVSVVDEPEKSRALGAVAHFTKPVTRAQLAGFFQRAAVTVARPAPPCVALPPPIGPAILLAEDNEANIQTIGGYLEDKGYALHYATNGLAAVKLAREIRPALILMDIQMPVMDGLAAMKEIRADVALKDTPIVALTALAMPGDRERCLAAGATDYLSKPVSMKALVELVEKLVMREK